MGFVKYTHQYISLIIVTSHSPVLDAYSTEHVSTRQSASGFKNDVVLTDGAPIEFGVHVYPGAEYMFVEPHLHNRKIYGHLYIHVCHT